MHFVGAVDDLQRARVFVHVAEAVVVSDARAAEGLDRPIHDLAGHVGGGDLDLGDLPPAFFFADLVHLPGGVQHEQTHLIDLDAARREALDHHALLGERLAERRPLVQPPAHQLQRPLRESHCAHAMVDATGSEASLRDLEALALAEEDVLGRDA